MKLLALYLQSYPMLGALAVLTSLGTGAVSGSLLAVLNVTLTTGRLLEGRYFALVAIAIACGLGSRLVLLVIASRLGAAVRMRLGRGIVEAPLPQLETRGAPALTAVLAEDTAVLADGFELIARMASDLSVTAAGVVYAFCVMPRAAWVVALVSVLGALAVAAFATVTLRNVAALRPKADQTRARIADLTLGIKELQLSQVRRVSFLRDALRPELEQLRAHNVRNEATNAAMRGAVMLLFYATICGAILLSRQRTMVTQPAINGVVTFLLFLMVPVMSIVELVPSVSRVQHAARMVAELGVSLAGWRETTDGAGDTTSERAGGWSSIALEGVRYLYEGVDGGRRFAVGPIDLRLEPGRVLFVVGGNGSGKSTLVKLLVGLYTPTHGRITVDGAAVTAASCARYRERFAVVFADAHVFATLPDGEGEAAAERDARARVALARLGLEGTVTLEHGVLSTTRALSTGQRKRLALALACLEERDVYVFDEWAADQDPASREAFYTHLLPELRARGKAVVVVTHDEAYFHLADVRVQLGDGRIVATAADALAS